MSLTYEPYALCATRSSTDSSICTVLLDIMIVIAENLTHQLQRCLHHRERDVTQVNKEKGFADTHG
jgi:hypothetical protein